MYGIVCYITFWFFLLLTYLLTWHQTNINFFNVDIIVVVNSQRARTIRNVVVDNDSLFQYGRDFVLRKAAP